ncbi:MAG: 4Fe-4S binding protein [Oscillospiraceae bacterium]|nr:4Fe-4S binding protein [Oscillospiraceae bacterium]
MIYELLFSATGRSKKILDTVSGQWSGEKTLVDLSATDMEVPQITAEDICIFTTSVFEGRVPAPAVRNFEKLKGNGAKIILVAVFGNRAIDDCLLEMKNLSLAQGFVPVGAMEVSVQHSIIPKVEPTRPDREDIAEIKAFADTIRKAIEEKTEFGQLDVPGNYPYVEMGGLPLHPKANKKCIDCGLCAKKCPTGAIPADNPRITDGDKCITCMRCVEICPKDARDFPAILVSAAYMAMKSKFAGRKPNKIYMAE